MAHEDEGRGTVSVLVADLASTRNKQLTYLLTYLLTATFSLVLNHTYSSRPTLIDFYGEDGTRHRDAFSFWRDGPVDEARPQAL